jgi:hypothetical protein
MPVVAAHQHPAKPAEMTHQEHMSRLKQPGQAAMGFDQDKAAHHFTLTVNGGTIAVSTLAATDQGTRDQIRTHLQAIARAFGRGEFEKPLMTHGEVPPGVSRMQRHKGAITYAFEWAERGGIVRIATSNADALNAIHDFLRYQIREHATGDSTTVRK